MHIRMYSDGGARGNPGPAAGAAVLFALDGAHEAGVLKEVSAYLGETTNNQAEYHGLRMGLEAAKEFGATHVEVRMDSELIVRQLLGQYRVKQPDLAKRYHEVKQLCTHFAKVSFQHVLRAQNAHADRLVNEAIDAHLSRATRA